jgi:ABC-type transporter Mla MlaB component
MVEPAVRIDLVMRSPAYGRLVVSGDLVRATATGFLARGVRIVGAVMLESVLIDLAEIEAVDHAGVTALAALCASIERAGTTVRLAFVPAAALAMLAGELDAGGVDSGSADGTGQ